MSLPEAHNAKSQPGFGLAFARRAQGSTQYCLVSACSMCVDLFFRQRTYGWCLGHYLVRKASHGKNQATKTVLKGHSAISLPCSELASDDNHRRSDAIRILPILRSTRTADPKLRKSLLVP
jgi:hypothetical protein